MRREPPSPLIFTGLAAQLPEHSAAGKCIAFKRGEWRGGSYLVRLPDGEERWMRCSDYEKAVRKVTPKYVHLIQPQIEAGTAVNITQPDSGYSSYGAVTKVTHDRITVLDVSDNKVREVCEVNYPVSPSFLAAYRALVAKDETALAERAVELTWREQDELFMFHPEYAGRWPSKTATMSPTVPGHVAVSAAHLTLLSSDLDAFRAARPDLDEIAISSLLKLRAAQSMESVVTTEVTAGGPEIG